MYTRVIVKEEDLLPVSFDEEIEAYNCDGFVSYTETDPDTLRRRGLRLISISEDMKKRIAEDEKKQHEAWIVEKILPIALMMYNRHYEGPVSLDQWKQYYDRKNSAAMRWVKTAEMVYKTLNPQDADK